jgi:hypothetical protein
MSKRVIIAISVVVVSILVGVWWYWQRDRNLSEAPPESALAPPPDTAQSTIAVNVTVPFSLLAAQAEKSAPSNYSDGGNGPDACVDLGLLGKSCAGTQYHFSVSRGPISFGPGPDNSIRAAVPLAISGKGGFRGDGAKLLSLDAKNFRGKVEAYADMKLGLECSPFRLLTVGT